MRWGRGAGREGLASCNQIKLEKSKPVIL